MPIPYEQLKEGLAPAIAVGTAGTGAFLALLLTGATVEHFLDRFPKKGHKREQGRAGK